MREREIFFPSEERRTAARLAVVLQQKGEAISSTRYLDTAIGTDRSLYRSIEETKLTCGNQREGDFITELK